MLQCDSVPAHNTLRLRQFLAKKKIAALEQRPDPPDLAASVSPFIPRAQRVVMERTCFDAMNDMKMAAITELPRIPDEFFPGVCEGGAENAGKAQRDYIDGIL